MQGRVQISCGYVDIHTLIIHDDNLNQGYFVRMGRWGKVEAGLGYSAKIGVGREFIAIILIIDTLQ